RHVERAARVDGTAVRRDELAGLLALEPAADPPDQIALESDDAHARAEVRHPGVHGEVRRQLADVEQPAVAPVREEPARTVQVVELREVVSLPVEDLYAVRSEEHTSELQSRGQLVCRLLLEKKKDS